MVNVLVGLLLTLQALEISDPVVWLSRTRKQVVIMGTAEYYVVAHLIPRSMLFQTLWGTEINFDWRVPPK